MDIEGFSKYLLQEGYTSSTQFQYVTFLNRFNEHLTNTNTTKITIQDIQKFINTLESVKVKTWGMVVIKKYLIYMKSPVIFDMEKIEVKE